MGVSIFWKLKQSWISLNFKSFLIFNMKQHVRHNLWLFLYFIYLLVKNCQHFLHNSPQILLILFLCSSVILLQFKKTTYILFRRYFSSYVFFVIFIKSIIYQCSILRASLNYTKYLAFETLIQSSLKVK